MGAIVFTICWFLFLVALIFFAVRYFKKYPHCGGLVWVFIQSGQGQKYSKSVTVFRHTMSVSPAFQRAGFCFAGLSDMLIV